MKVHSKQRSREKASEWALKTVHHSAFNKASDFGTQGSLIGSLVLLPDGKALLENSLTTTPDYKQLGF